MSIDVQGDFSNYFDMVQSKATGSSFYQDIKKYFEEGRIDTKTFASIMIEFNRDTLKEAIDTGRSMSIGVRELELKTNESKAEIELSNRRKQAIGEELAIKNSELAIRQSELALAQNINSKELTLYSARITTETNRASLIARQTAGFNDNLKIKKAEHSSSLYGMIESGGNEAPTKLVNLVMSSLNDI